jgi:WD repeat-containing protein 40A
MRLNVLHWEYDICYKENMNTLYFLKNRPCQLEPKDLYPTADMTQIDNDISAQNNLHRHLPHLISEKTLDIGKSDKIFASSWLSDELFLLGTKSNQLLLVDMFSDKISEIPLLKNKNTPFVRDSSGIHCMQISADGQYLATGGSNVNELAIYKLPELTPYIVGQGHTDWLFDTAWISDNVLVTGSRDSTMGVWKIPDIATLLVEDRLSLSSLSTVWSMGYPLAEYVPKMDSLFRFSNYMVQPIHGTKVRSLACNKDTGILASLQASPFKASTHFWDSETFTELCSVDMPYSSENVCLELQKEYNIYAIGSRSHVSFIDGRLANQAIGVIKSKDRECGVRSLQFKNELISIGTGGGKVFFYDLRASNYLPSNGSQAHSTQEICSLRTTPGWVVKNNLILL